MSVIQKGPVLCEWRALTVIPWYRQTLALVFGIGVMIVALYGIPQGESGFVIASIVGMSLLTILLIFGVEVNHIKIGDKIQIDFTNTSRNDYDE